MTLTLFSGFILAAICVLLGSYVYKSGFKAGYNIGAKESGKAPLKEAPKKTRSEKKREAIEKEKDRREIERLETLKANIDAFDGTGAGQKEID